MTGPTAQVCSTKGCSQPAVYRTRTKPSWCDDCIEEILRLGGMKAIERVRKPNYFTLMQCLACGTHTHNRFEYLVGNNRVGLKTCRSCHWREWGAMQRSHLDLHAPTIGDARAHAEANGYEYLGPLTTPSLAGDPHHVRCRQCTRLTAERLSDIGFGCACSRNGKSRSKTTVKAARSRTKTVLFKDSGAEAILWWDHERNSEVDFETASKLATRTAAWVCPTCAHEFRATIRQMADWLRCPQCEALRRDKWHIEYEGLKRTPVTEVPELLAAWDDPTNPATVTVGGGWQLYRFVCKNGHHPRARPVSFMQSGCSHCRAAETRRTKATPRLAEEFPEIAAQWHPTKNGNLTPEEVGSNSKRTVWWRDEQCGHEWEEAVAVRNKYQRYLCPECRTILDSLAYQYPLLAKEWSPRNPVSPWNVRPHGKTLFTPEWICPTDPEHIWTASLTARTNGSDCPDCRQAGKSKVELDHFNAAKAVFGNARSGVLLKAKEFKRRPAWTADITVSLPNGHTLVIEYDGSYWHRDKREVDRAKSLDLLAGGNQLARLREHPLPTLGIEDTNYAEITVYADAPAPRDVMKQIKVLIDPRSHSHG